MSETEPVVTETVNPEEELMADVMETSTITEFFGLVFSGDWKNLDVSEQQLLRDRLEAFVSGVNQLRENFDGQVWKGHADGTVPTTVKSIRKQREGDKPGRKPAELTPAQILAKRLSK